MQQALSISSTAEIISLRFELFLLDLAMFFSFRLDLCGNNIITLKEQKNKSGNIRPPLPRAIMNK